MKASKYIRKIIVSIFILTTYLAIAEETKLEKAESAKNRAEDSAKADYREIKDKVCEMIDGKMHCVARKMKHKLKNASDTIKTEATEVKNKVN